MKENKPFYVLNSAVRSSMGESIYQGKYGKYLTGYSDIVSFVSQYFSYR